MKVEYNKIVRDKIPEIIRDSGRTCDYKILGESEVKDALYSYNGENQRLSKKVNADVATLYSYDGSKLSEEIDGST